MTPFDSDSFAVGIHLPVAAMSNVLSSPNLHLIKMSCPIAVGFLGGPVLRLYLSYYGIFKRWVIGTSGMLVWVTLILWLLQLNYLLPCTWPLFLIGLSLGLIELSAQWVANANLQQDVERLWQTYHHDLLIQEASGQQTGQLASLAEAFGRSQSLYGAIARRLSVGLVAAGWEGDVWFCNPAASHFLQLAMGQSLADVLMPQWLNPSAWEYYLHTLRQGQSIHWEHYQDEQWFELTLEPLAPLGATSSVSPQSSCWQATVLSQGVGFPFCSDIKGGGRTQSTQTAPHEPGFLLVIEDITSYKQAELKIRQALEQEKEFSELKSRFVSMVSHELRTPLTIIQSSTELLQRRYQTLAINPSQLPPCLTSAPSLSGYQRSFGRIRQAIATMTQLLEDALSLSRMESQTLGFKPTLVNPVQLCQTLMDDLQVYPLSTPRIVLTHQRTPATDYRVSLDATLFGMILTNLLSNALKYSPDDACVHVTLTLCATHLTLQVADQGIGIPPESQPQLFEAFHRASNVGSVPGTGLGLSIVKQCVDLHGGTISVDSIVGKGTTFLVTLPSGTI